MTTARAQSPASPVATSEERRLLCERIAAAEVELHAVAMRWVDPVATSADLTLRQLQVLALLRALPGATGQQLAESVGVSTPTMSGIVDRIASKGWLEREHDPQDRRRVLLRLTTSAEAVLAELEVPVHRMRSLILDRLDESDLRDLARLTDRMRDAAREVEVERSGDTASA
ncbi:MarR family winged helix-turn-helix transcriptional regulator [Ornithinimicrobium sp. W1665]|uniref:MarR family winged helix-turn-helix transcriptional regulator n=1 Tax=Ornithinimicrobium sp. W1665 TaxID=3416666 RepID=UPI003CF0301D